MPDELVTHIATLKRRNALWQTASAISAGVCIVLFMAIILGGLS